jgi:hypothetical protein
VALVCEPTILSEPLPLFDDVSANFLRIEGFYVLNAAVLLQP